MIRNWDVEAGDIVTSGGNQFLEGKAETGASVRHRLLMFFGEFFLDIADGTPWFQSILGKKPQDIAEQALKERISTDPNVVAISQFTFDSDRTARSITVDAQVVDINNEAVRIITGGPLDEGGGSSVDPLPPIPQPKPGDVVNLNPYSIVVDE